MFRNCLVYIFSFLICSMYIGQTDLIVYASHFTKQGRVIIRLLPNSKKSFDTLRNHNLYLKRYTIVNGAPQNEVYIKSNIHPFEIADTASWLTFVRKYKSVAAFVYQNLYPEIETLKKNNAVSKGNTAKVEKQIFDMLMLSCDFYSDAAKACGLYVADSTINNDQIYEYKLGYLSSKGGNKEILKFNVNANKLSQDSATPFITLTKKKKVATVKWHVRNNYFSGFNIERSEDGINYVRLNKAPIVYLQGEQEVSKRWIEHKDTLPNKQVKYYYRLKGINLFGEESVNSNICAIYNHLEITSYPLIDSAINTDGKISLKWEMTKKSETGLIKNYIVMRSDKEKGKYIVLSNVTHNTSYIDQKPLPVNFYKIVAVTEDNDSISSYLKMVSVNDNTPPLIPIGLKAVSDKKGNVTISWNRNKEQDLKGYKLLTANALHEEFVMINTEFITDTFFNHKLSLNNLSRFVYYTIVATDKNYNSSKKAIPIKVSRPDTIPPAKPLISKTNFNQEGIILNFIPSLSEDVSTYHLLRSDLINQNYLEIKSFKSPDTLRQFIDTSVILGNSYVYKLKACDQNNNCSFSNEVQVEYETGYREPVSNVKATTDRTLHHIFLQWDEFKEKVFNYTIYRSSNKQPYTIIKSLDPSKVNYIDKNLNMGNTYYYMIKATLVNGAETIFTKPIEVEY